LARGNWDCRGRTSPIARSLFFVVIDSLRAPAVLLFGR
jgi:hypothetical protein